MPERTSLARDVHEGFRSPGWAPLSGAEHAASPRTEHERLPDWQRAEERYRLLLTTIAERVWRFALTPPLELRGEPRGLAAAMLRRARLVECNPPWAHEPDDAGAETPPSLWLSDVLMGTYTEQLDLLERFVRSEFRLVDVRTTEWDRTGHARTVFTNLVGMVECGQLQGIWGAQRPVEADQPLERLPVQFSETLPDDVTLLDEHGVILFESPSMEQRLGYSARGRSGDRVYDHVHPEDSEALREALAEVRLTPGSTGPVVKLRARHADGQWQPRAAVVRHLAAIPGPPLLALSLLEGEPGVPDASGPAARTLGAYRPSRGAAE